MATITINKGDTLSALAAKHGTTVAALATANKIADPNKIQAGGSLNIPDKPGVTPTSAVGSIKQDPKVNPATAAAQSATKQPGSMTDFQTTLKNALNEAGKARLASNYEKAGGLTGGVPGSLGSVVDMIKSGPATDVASTFKTVVDSQTAQQKNSLDLLKEFASDGSLAEMPDAALLKLSATAGLPEGTALAWKARITTASKQSDQKAAMELKLIQSQIDENYAQANNARTNQNATTRATSRDETVNADLEKGKGEDGFVSAGTYQGALRKFIANGGTQANFIASFPQSTYLRGEEIKKLPAALQGVQTAGVKSLSTRETSLINSYKAKIDQVKQQYGDVESTRNMIIQQSIQNEDFDPSPYF